MLIMAPADNLELPEEAQINGSQVAAMMLQRMGHASLGLPTLRCQLSYILLLSRFSQLLAVHSSRINMSGLSTEDIETHH